VTSSDPRADDTIAALRALDAFYLEHDRCGFLEGDCEKQEDGSAVVWMACERCGARIVRKA
jgi:hypothetical protein